MDRREALEILGLAEPATDEAIHARWRELVQQMHPDTKQGDVEATIRINEARAVALRAATTDLVPLNQVTEIVRATAGALAERDERRAAQQRAQGVTRAIVRAHTSPLKEARRQTAVFIGLGALVALLGQALNAFESSFSARAEQLATLAGAFIAFSAGLVIWIYTERARRLEEMIEDASDTLDDRSNVVAVLQEISAHAEAGDPPWTRDELRQLCEAWVEPESRDASAEDWIEERVPLVRFERSRDAPTLASLARRVGAGDFTKLVIAKGLATEVLSEMEVWADDGRLHLVYDFNRPETD
jgi:hypothetical protein